MNSKVPKWMLRDPAGNRSEEASQNKTEEVQEMGTGKRLRRTVDSEGGVEEFLCLLEKIEETKKQLQRNRSKNSSGGCSVDIAEEKDQIMNMEYMQQQAQGSDHFVRVAPYTSSSSHWKPSFQSEDLNMIPVSVRTDLSRATETAAAVLVSSTDENPKGGGSSVQIGNGRRLETRSLLDIISADTTPAGCSYDHMDGLNNEDHVDAPPELELRLFPI